MSYGLVNYGKVQLSPIEIISFCTTILVPMLINSTANFLNLMSISYFGTVNSQISGQLLTMLARDFEICNSNIYKSVC